VHLADGIVTSPALVIGLDLVGAGAVALAARSSRLGGAGDASETRGVAWTGMVAAFVLAAQAVNLPLLPGTSAHAIGTCLATLVLGPARAVIALTAVLLVQALLFADGGVAVLGINVLTLAVLPALCVELTARLAGEHRRCSPVVAAVGATLGGITGAALLSTVLVVGAGASAAPTFSWLIGIQGAAGLCEGLLTAVAVRELARRVPQLLPGAAPAASAPGGAAFRRPSLAWAAIAVGLVTACVPLASDQPDALERLLPELPAASPTLARP
jgi:cobalt/nickel transport system permease protein